MKKLAILFLVLYSSSGLASEPFDQFSKDLIRAINQKSSTAVDRLSLGKNSILFSSKSSEGSIPENYRISFKELSSKEIETNTNLLETVTKSECKFVKPPTHQVQISWDKEPPFRAGHLCYRTESSSMQLFFANDKQPKLVTACSDKHKNNFQENKVDILSAQKGQLLSKKQLAEYSLLMESEGYRAVVDKLTEINPKLSLLERRHYIDEICKTIP